MRSIKLMACISVSLLLSAQSATAGDEYKCLICYSPGTSCSKPVYATASSKEECTIQSGDWVKVGADDLPIQGSDTKKAKKSTGGHKAEAPKAQ